MKREGGGLNGFQRLALACGTRLTAERAVSLSESELTFSFLVDQGVKPANFGAAQIGPLQMKRIGAETAGDLSKAGFVSLHLCDEKWASEAVSAYGAEDLRETFFQGPADSVALAGTRAADLLELGVNQLMEQVAGLPTEAFETLKQIQGRKRTEGLSAITLLDSGLRASQLRMLSIGPTQIRSMKDGTPEAVKKLGF